MALYLLEFVDHGGNAFSTHEIEHDDDESAIEHAHRLHAPNIGAGFDLWHGDRLVHRDRRG
jgi:hypothetical protein